MNARALGFSGWMNHTADAASLRPEHMPHAREKSRETPGVAQRERLERFINTSGDKNVEHARLVLADRRSERILFPRVPDRRVQNVCPIGSVYDHTQSKHYQTPLSIGYCERK